MWEAISYVSSGLTLVAFIVAVAAWLYKSQSEVRGQLIREAAENRRAELVQNALEIFHVETSGLTKEQQSRIALEQIAARTKRFRTVAIVVCFLALVAGGVSVFAITYAPPNVTGKDDNRWNLKAGLYDCKVNQRLMNNCRIVNTAEGILLSFVTPEHNIENVYDKISVTLTQQGQSKCWTGPVTEEFGLDGSAPTVSRQGDAMLCTDSSSSWLGVWTDMTGATADLSITRHIESKSKEY